MDEWLYQIQHEEEHPPNPRQLSALEFVRDRLLREMESENKFPAFKRRRQSAESLDTRQKDAEARARITRNRKQCSHAMGHTNV